MRLFGLSRSKPKHSRCIAVYVVKVHIMGKVSQLTYELETPSCRLSQLEILYTSTFDNQCLRSLVGVSRMDGVRNEEVRRRAGIERELASRADQRVLRWFGHVERMDEYRMAT